MKTHPDSIFIEDADVGNARVRAEMNHGSCVAMIADGVNAVKELESPLEFVPASAYVEAIRERDEARSKLAGQLDLLARIVNASTLAHSTRLEADALVPEQDTEWPDGYDFDELNAAQVAAGEAADALQVIINEARATIAQLRTAETERPLVWKPTEGPDEWAWYREDVGRAFGGFATEADAIADSVANEGDDHRIRVGVLRDVDPAELFALDDVVDQAECQLNDMVEDGRVHPLDGAADALADWARRYLEVDPSRICEGRQVFPAEKEEE